MNIPALGVQTNPEISPPNNAGLAAVALRYGLSSIGPLCISAAHFIAAILFLRVFTRAEFGLFSFVLVIVPFCLSLSGALIGAPVAIAVRTSEVGARDLSTYLQANLAFSALAAMGIFSLLELTRTDWNIALLFGAYGGAMTLRWFARTLWYATSSASRVFVSDLVYGVVLLAGLFLAYLLRRLTPLGAAEILLAAALAGLLSFGRSYLKLQFLVRRFTSLGGYRRIWLDLARWSALGVVLTELTANAHAYLVTFLAGPAAFAPLALGALLVRPIQLVLAAVPDRERPVMARLLAAGNYLGARKIVNHFRMAAGAIWLATITLSAVLLMWFPHLVLKKGYDPAQAMVVLALFAAITAARSMRTPESVLLQAAGQFRALAGASLWSCSVSLIATLTLLLLAGPVSSLAGILAGELMMTSRVLALSRHWMRSHV